MRRPFFGDEDKKADCLAWVKKLTEASQFGEEAGMDAALDMNNLYVENEFEEILNAPNEVGWLVNHLSENANYDQWWNLHFRFFNDVNIDGDSDLWLSKFYIWLLMDESDGVIRYADEAGAAGIRQVVELHQRALKGETPTGAEWQAAWVTNEGRRPNDSSLFALSAARAATRPFWVVRASRTAALAEFKWVADAKAPIFAMARGHLVYQKQAEALLRIVSEGVNDPTPHG